MAKPSAQDYLPGSVIVTAHPDQSTTFVWTENHIQKSRRDVLRHEYDEMGSQALERLQLIIKSQQAGLEPGQAPPRADLFATLRDNYANDPVLTELWTEVNTVPSWVDWDQIARAQLIFPRHALANVVGFALRGFLAEDFAQPSITEVLARTGGFSGSNMLRRWIETYQWLMLVTKSLADMQPGGDAWTSTVRVRLLHASVRQRILKLAESRPGYYDVPTWGPPISTLYSIQSIVTFACSPLWHQLPQLGVVPTQQERDDYIALWRYIAYLIGTPQECFASTAHARATMESFQSNGFQYPSESAKNMGYNFIENLADVPPFNVSRGFIEAGSRVLNGDSFCNAMGMNQPSLTAYASFRGFCWFVTGLGMCQRLVPALDRRVTQFWHSAMQTAIMQDTSKFDFKYVPDIDRVRVPRHPSERKSPSLFRRPTDSFFLVVFVLVILGFLALTVAFAYLLVSMNGALFSGTLKL